MSFPDGLTVDATIGQKDNWFLVSAQPSIQSITSFAYITYQTVYRLSIARRYAAMTGFACQNGQNVGVVDVSGLPGGGFWTSAAGSVVAPDWSGLSTSLYVDRHCTNPDSPMSSKGEETMDLIYVGPFQQIPFLSLNATVAFPESLTAAAIDGDTNNPGGYILQSVTPELDRFWNFVAGKWFNQNKFTIQISRKFARLSGFVTAVDNYIEVAPSNAMPTLYSGPGIVTGIDWSLLTARSDGKKVLYILDECVNITDSISGQGEQILTMISYGQPFLTT
jgi:hypothetical protein